MPPTIEDLHALRLRDWTHLNFLVAHLHRTKNLPHDVAQWDLTIQLFRDVEQKHFYEQEPTELDRLNHLAILHILIGLGQQLEIRARGFTSEELDRMEVARADLAAYIRNLEDTLFMWHWPDPEPARTRELQKAIFGADPSDS